jgi:hypothetical protein
VSSSAKTTWLARKLREKLGANTLAWSVLDRHLPASRTAAKAGSGRIVKPSWRPKPAPGKFSGSLGRQAGSGGRNRPILAAKAGSGRIVKPSWRPKPAPGKFSGSLGRQAGSGGRNRPILAAKAGSGEFFSPSWPRKRRVDFVRRNFGGEEWIVDLAMDSFGRQSSAKNSPGARILCQFGAEISPGALFAANPSGGDPIFA